MGYRRMEEGLVGRIGVGREIMRKVERWGFWFMVLVF